MDWELDGFEFARMRLREELVEIVATHGDDFLGDIKLHPGGSLDFRSFVALEIRALAAPGIADNLPAVAGEVGAMNDDGGDGAAARGFFELVGPAAVVGESFAFEEFGIVRSGLVD